jgi:hypothetical protein
MSALQKIKSILSSPFIGGVSLLIAIIALYFYFTDKSEIEPSYAVSTPESIAQKLEGKMKILWEDREVTSVNIVRIIIWNNGSKYLDKGMISNDEPIRIISDQNIKILSARRIRSSRKNCKFLTSIKRNADSFDHVYSRPYIDLELEGDEVLEEDDGNVIKIIYSGSVDCDFTVNARIKGHPEGFDRIVGYFEGFRPSFVLFLSLSIVPLPFFLFFMIYNYNKKSSFLTKEYRKRFFNHVIKFVIICGFILLIVVSVLLYFPTQLSWAT